jgi:hypothetical protein
MLITIVQWHKLIVLNQMNISLTWMNRNMQISHSNMINPRYENYLIIFIRFSKHKHQWNNMKTTWKYFFKCNFLSGSKNQCAKPFLSPGNVLKPRLRVINIVTSNRQSSPQSICYIRYKKLNFIPSLTTVEAPEKEKNILVWF